jgi:hypothetical protein
MPIRRVVSRAVAFSLVVLLAVAARAETAGAPLKGVDVKLGRNPGGTALRTVTTDEFGVARLGTLERGSYYLLIAAPTKPADPVVLSLEIRGAMPNPTTYRYNRRVGTIVSKNNVTVVSTVAERAKRELPEKIPFDSDGKHPVMVTIVKSKSNITNN